MAKEKDNKINRLGAMKALNIGESVSFPLDALFAVRTAASNINTVRGCKSLTSQVNREKGVISITRIA